MINASILKPRIEKSYPYNYNNKYKLSQKGIKTFKFSNPENAFFCFQVLKLIISKSSNNSCMQNLRIKENVYYGKERRERVLGCHTTPHFTGDVVIELFYQWQAWSRNKGVMGLIEKYHRDFFQYVFGVYKAATNKSS